MKRLAPKYHTLKRCRTSTFKQTEYGQMDNDRSVTREICLLLDRQDRLNKRMAGLIDEQREIVERLERLAILVKSTTSNNHP